MQVEVFEPNCQGARLHPGMRLIPDAQTCDHIYRSQKTMRLQVMLEYSVAVCDRITHRVYETCLGKVFDEVLRQLVICQGLGVNDQRMRTGRAPTQRHAVHYVQE